MYTTSPVIFENKLILPTMTGVLHYLPDSGLGLHIKNNVSLAIIQLIRKSVLITYIQHGCWSFVPCCARIHSTLPVGMLHHCGRTCCQHTEESPATLGGPAGRAWCSRPAVVEVEVASTHSCPWKLCFKRSHQCLFKVHPCKRSHSVAASASCP